MNATAPHEEPPLPTHAGASDPDLPPQVADAAAWEPSTRLGRFVVRPIAHLPGPKLLRAYQVTAGIALVIANLIGAAIIVVLNLFVVPGASLPDGTVGQVLLIGAATWITIAFFLGGALILRQSNQAWVWLRQARAPTLEEELAVLRAPLRVMRTLVSLWMIAAIGAIVITAFDSGETAVRFGLTCLIGGLSTSAFGYLLVERVMRPAARVVLTHRPDATPALPSVATRQILTWLLGTGSAVLGVWLVGLFEITGAIEGTTAGRLGRTMFVLSSITLTAGLFAEVVTARAVGDPIRELRRAVRRLTEGDLAARVDINDATDFGLLQAGFNEMATGIEEREALRDLFGRHVGDEIAETALERGAELGGQTREVAAMFVDVIGSTSIAMQRPAGEVVELINRFFEVIVTVTARHGGVVNKFAGDGALIIFGAPVAQDDYATHALACARELADALVRDASETPATIGLSGGEVIAGNMGTQERFEYTVMGDPVNEAARLGSQAKLLPQRVAASGRLVAQASLAERDFWDVAYSVVLRGRDARTDVASLKLR
ncbi:MAG: adenylate/guanylate cyclase domain-containing protein [Solirubrobacteraceae bacterium]|nr:adenylate/guanylate cyclase domain-containing protein [Solirubrobacteraceae bacterium]